MIKLQIDLCMSSRLLEIVVDLEHRLLVEFDSSVIEGYSSDNIPRAYSSPALPSYTILIMIDNQICRRNEKVAN